MRRRKPDLIILLAIMIGLGVVVTGYALDMGPRTAHQASQVIK